MKLILFFVGITLALWTGAMVYNPVQTFVTDIQKVYLQSKAIQRTIVDKSGTSLNTITDAYKEIARVFGVDVADKNAKQEVSTPVPNGTKDPIEKLFEYNIAFWVSAGVSFMVLSLYLNMISLISFFFKPLTFFMKK
jgi:hypothetical protein